MMQARLKELRDARASSVRDVQFGDERIVYRSDSELAAAIADLETKIAAAEGHAPIAVVNIRNNRGWS